MKRNALALLVLLATTATAFADCRDTVRSIVAGVQRADYEGDRAALQRLYEQLTPFANDAGLGSRVHYWRGFALWRKTINGFNDSVDHKELERDLEQAVREFEESTRRDPSFVESKIAVVGCAQSLFFINRNDEERIKELIARFRPLFKEVGAEAAENPRMLWLVGAQRWYEGKHDVATATYEKALQLAWKEKERRRDPLDPAWGEPELLMSLAWSSLNAKEPDATAAEEYAKQALEIVPYWHYVGDILMPQIRKQQGQ